MLRGKDAMKSSPLWFPVPLPVPISPIIQDNPERIQRWRRLQGRDAWQIQAVLLRGVPFHVPLQQLGCSFYFGEGRLIWARYNTQHKRVVSLLAGTEVVHPLHGTVGCQNPIPTLPAPWQQSNPIPHRELR